MSRTLQELCRYVQAQNQDKKCLVLRSRNEQFSTEKSQSLDFDFIEPNTGKALRAITLKIFTHQPVVLESLVTSVVLRFSRKEEPNRASEIYFGRNFEALLHHLSKKFNATISKKSHQIKCADEDKFEAFIDELFDLYASASQPSEASAFSKRIAGRKAPSLQAPLPEEIQDHETLPEGAKKQIVVNAYERNQEARSKCLAEYGYNCCVCGFNFEDQYGEIGKQYIHVHHLRPLSEIEREYEVNPITDLRPVCPNCHAMLHRGDPLLTIEELRRQIRTTFSQNVVNFLAPKITGKQE